MLECITSFTLVSSLEGCEEVSCPTKYSVNYNRRNLPETRCLSHRHRIRVSVRWRKSCILMLPNLANEVLQYDDDAFLPLASADARGACHLRHVQ